MTDALQLLQAALPYFLAAFIFAAWWSSRNMTLSVTWAAKTSEPEPNSETIAKVKRERDQARLYAQDLRDQLDGDTDEERAKLRKGLT